jgi:predicted N-acetyltransferase YhbS
MILAETLIKETHPLEIRTASPLELDEILGVHRAAFGVAEGPEIVELVRNLLVDDTASPHLSLVAIDKGDPVGHVLFTRARLTGPEEPLSIQLLAPLAVRPEAQKRGVGTRLIEAGLTELKQAGVALVFVLGHPGYYPRCGFTPAGVLGFEAPYPIPEKNAAAWMVLDLTGTLFGKVSGRVRCAEALDRPEYWRE